MVRRRRGPAAGESGHALLVTLMVLLLVSLSVALAAETLLRGVRVVGHEARKVQLTALSDAAVAETLAHLSRDGSFSGVAPHAYGGGEIGSEVVATGSHTWRLKAWASYGQLRRTVRLDVDRSPQTDRITVTGWRELPSH